MKTHIMAILLICVLIFPCACTNNAESRQSVTTQNQLPNDSQSPLGSTAESAIEPSSHRLQSMLICLFAGGPLYPGEDREHSVEIQKDGTDYIGIQNKFGTMSARILSTDEMQQIDKILSEASVSEWDGYDIHETDLYDGFSVYFHIAYEDGAAVSGRGYGHEPHNYSNVLDQIESLIADPENRTGIVFSMEGGPVVEHDTMALSLKIFNNSDREIGYGRDFTLYRKTDGEWNVLKWRDGATQKADYVVLPPFSTNGYLVLIEELFGSALEAGEYRLEKQFSLETGPVVQSIEFVVIP